MDMPDVTLAQKGAIGQFVAAVTAAAALGLTEAEFIAVVASAVLLSAVLVICDMRLRGERNHTVRETVKANAKKAS